MKNELIEIIKEVTGYSTEYDMDEINDELEDSQDYYMNVLKIKNLQEQSNNDYDWRFFIERKSVSLEEAIEFIENAEEGEFIHFHKDTKRHGVYGVDVWDIKTEEKMYELA